MDERDHEVQLRLAELRIQRAKLVGVVATSIAAVATAALVVVPIVTGQRDAAAVPLSAGQPTTSGSVVTSGSTSQPDEPVAPTHRDVCAHVMDIMKREFGDAEGAKAPSDEEMAKFENKCVDDLATEKQKIGATKFEAQVRCVMAASTMEELMRCDKG